jgi:hypothetical protein
LYGAATLLRSEFSGSSDQREDHLHHSGIFGVTTEYRPQATTFTESGASITP